MVHRNSYLTAIAAAAALAATVSYAQEFPSQPITINHGSAAGANQDVMLRELAQALEGVAGVPVVVEPRPGGSGQVAMARVQGQSPDGYTIFSDGTGITAILQMEGAAYSMDDFRPLYRIQLDPLALYVNDESPLKSVDDLVEAMRATPSDILLGGYGTATPFQFMALTLGETAGVEPNWVPYNSGSDAITGVMAGDLDVAISNISAYSRFRENTRVIAVSSADRVAPFNDIPTLIEQGYPLEQYHWRGMFLHGDTPDDIAESLHQLIDKAVATPEFQDFLSRTSTLSGKMTRDEFQAMLEEQAQSDRIRMVQLGLIEE
jgi:tripartite-type tricarboxylate transporter receptor subunit TctC